MPWAYPQLKDLGTRVFAELMAPVLRVFQGLPMALDGGCTLRAHRWLPSHDRLAKGFKSRSCGRPYAGALLKRCRCQPKAAATGQRGPGAILAQSTHRLAVRLSVESHVGCRGRCWCCHSTCLCRFLTQPLANVLEQAGKTVCKICLGVTPRLKRGNLHAVRAPPMCPRDC